MKASRVASLLLKRPCRHGARQWHLHSDMRLSAQSTEHSASPAGQESQSLELGHIVRREQSRRKERRHHAASGGSVRPLLSAQYLRTPASIGVVAFHTGRGTNLGIGRCGCLIRHLWIHHLDDDDQADRSGEVPMAPRGAGRATVLGCDVDHGGSARVFIVRSAAVALVLAALRSSPRSTQ